MGITLEPVDEEIGLEAPPVTVNPAVAAPPPQASFLDTLRAGVGGALAAVDAQVQAQEQATFFGMTPEQTTSNALLRGGLQFGSDLAGVGAAIGSGVPGLDTIGGLSFIASDMMESAAKSVPARAPLPPGSPGAMVAAEKALKFSEEVTQIAPQLAAQIGGAAATGGSPVVFAALGMGPVVGSTYKESRRAGRTEWESKTDAAVAGTITFATERFLPGARFKKILGLDEKSLAKAGSSLVKKLGIDAILGANAEGMQEVLETLFTDLILGWKQNDIERIMRTGVLLEFAPGGAPPSQQAFNRLNALLHEYAVAATAGAGGGVAASNAVRDQYAPRIEDAVADVVEKGLDETLEAAEVLEATPEQQDELLADREADSAPRIKLVPVEEDTDAEAETQETQAPEAEAEAGVLKSEVEKPKVVGEAVEQKPEVLGPKTKQETVLQSFEKSQVDQGLEIVDRPSAVAPRTRSQKAVAKIAADQGVEVVYVSKPYLLKGKQGNLRVRGAQTADSIIIDSKVSGKRALLKLFGHEFTHSKEGTEEYRALHEWATTRGDGMKWYKIAARKAHARIEGRAPLAEWIKTGEGVQETMSVMVEEGAVRSGFYGALAKSDATLFERFVDFITRTLNKFNLTSKSALGREVLKVMKGATKVQGGVRLSAESVQQREDAVPAGLGNRSTIKKWARGEISSEDAAAEMMKPFTKKSEFSSAGVDVDGVNATIEELPNGTRRIEFGGVLPSFVFPGSHDQALQMAHDEVLDIFESINENIPIDSQFKLSAESVPDSTIKRALSDLKKYGGFTIDLRTGKVPTKGYAYSPYKPREKVLHRAGSVAARAYISKNWDLLKKRPHLFGGWKSAGKIYFDVGVLERNFFKAVDKARAADQEAMYDLWTGTEIKIPETGYPPQPKMPRKVKKGARVSGVKPYLLIDAPRKPNVFPSIPEGVNPKWAPQLASRLDEAAEIHPDPMASDEAFNEFQTDLLGTNKIPPAPWRAIYLKNNVDVLAAEVKALNDGAKRGAMYGLRLALKIKKAYLNGDMSAIDTMKLVFWGSLSKMMTPFPHEAGAIDAFLNEKFESMLQKAIDGKFDLDEWNDYVDTLLVNIDTVANQTKQNMRAYGKFFLDKMGKRDANGKQYFERMHEILSDYSISGRDSRRLLFSDLPGGVGINTKVWSFILLLTGRTDVIVLDRVQIRNFYDDGRYLGKAEVYDDMAGLFTGGKGLAYYEGLERSLEGAVAAAYKKAGRKEKGTLGRFHWEFWNSAAFQEATHGSIELFLGQALGNTKLIEGASAGETRMDVAEYGATYRYVDGQGVIDWKSPSGATYRMHPLDFRAFATKIRNKKIAIWPARWWAIGLKHTGKSSAVKALKLHPQIHPDVGRKPWHTLPGVNLDKLENQAKDFAARYRDNPNAPGGRDADVSRLWSESVSDEEAAAIIARAAFNPDPRPDLAKVSPDERARALQGAIDEYREGKREVRTDVQVRAAALVRIGEDIDGEQANIKAKGLAGKQLDDVETAIGKLLTNRAFMKTIESETQEDAVETIMLGIAWRETGVAQAQAFRQRRDEYMTPSQRVAHIFTKAITSMGPKQDAKLDKLRKVKEKQQAKGLPTTKVDTQIDQVVQVAAKEVVAAVKAAKEAGFEPGNAEQIFQDPIKTTRILRAAQKQKRQTGWLFELYIALILSGPQTNVANFTGNTLQITNRFATITAEALFNEITFKKVFGPEAPTLEEVRRMFMAGITGVVPAIKLAYESAKQDMPITQADIEHAQELAKSKGLPPDQIRSRSKFEQDRFAPALGHPDHHVVVRALGRIVRFPGLTLLTAFDELFLGLSFRMHLAGATYAYARREGLTGDELDARVAEIEGQKDHPAQFAAYNEALKVVFRDPGGKVSEAGLRIRKWLGWFGFLTLPFVNTPERLFAAGLSKTPLVTLPLLWRLTGKRSDAVRLSEDVTNNIIAWGFAIAVYSLLIDWEDEDGRPVVTGALWDESLGREAPPTTSILLGGKYYNYNRAEPLSVALATTIDAARAVKGALNSDDPNAWMKEMSALHFTLVRQMENKTFIRTLGELIGIATDKEKAKYKLPNLISLYASAPMPNLAKQALRASDPFVRERKTSLNSVGDLVAYSMWPSARFAPPPRVDIWGRDAEKVQPDWIGDSTGAYLYNLLVPSWAKEADDITRHNMMFIRYNERARDLGIKPVGIQALNVVSDRKIKGLGPQAIRFDRERYHKLSQIVGQRLAEEVGALNLNVENPTLEDIKRFRALRSKIHRQERSKLQREIAAEKGWVIDE